jgi:coenzyme F420-0:L-glutamate ligase/coenzyme F420-1:gamma-L-glutamate ligase
MGSLVLTSLTNFPLVYPGDPLAGIILEVLTQNGIQLVDGDILVLAQKIVSKSENRLVNLTDISPSNRAIELGAKTGKDPRMIQLVLRESSEVLRTRIGSIIVEHRLGFVCANAGIDHSNVNGSWGNAEDWVLLLPEDPDLTAKTIREEIESVSKAKIGVMIIDSHGRAWRLGTVGISIGISGVPGLVDLRGTPDMFGFELRITQVGAADELAAAASLVMGQAAEGTPVVHVRGFPYSLRESSLSELIRPKDQDMFR